MNREQRGQAGFSLIELLVAMTITLIVSGAIYGLLAGGQNAFRREPELTERQQNIRVAMDLIQRDVAGAGASLPPFMQVFTQGLDADAASPNGPTGAPSDQLELVTSSNRDSETVCSGPWTAATDTVFLTRREVRPPVPLNQLTFLVFSRNPDRTWDDRWTARRLTSQAPAQNYPGPTGAIPPDCTANSPHATMTFAPGDVTGMNPADLCAEARRPPVGNVISGTCAPALERLSRIVFAESVRYRIRNGADGVPSLERTSSPDDPDTFQTIARGIEEFQVQYATVGAPTTWVNAAPPVAAPVALETPLNYATLTGQVRITLTARANVTNIAGAVQGAGDDTQRRLRGSLTSTVAPRAVLMHVSQGRPASPGPLTPSPWYWE